MMGTSRAEIVAQRENVPPKLPSKKQVRAATAPEFCDAARWDELAAKHLLHYNLPPWNVPCEPAAILRWLGRLGMTEAEYVRRTRTSLVDFCALNPTWPLRAWIGTVLEMYEEARQ